MNLLPSVRNWHYNLLLKHPGWFLGFFLLLTLLAGYGLTKFQIDVSSAPFFPEDDPATITLENFERDFSSHENILLAVEFPETVFTDHSIDHLKHLMGRFAQIPDVTSVWSLVNVDTLAEHLVSSRNWDDLKRYMLQNPRYRSTLVSLNGKSAVIMLSPPPERREPEQDRILIRTLKQLIEREKRPDCRYHLSGMPIIRVDFSNLILKDQRTFGLLAAVLLSLFMFVLFRTFWGVVVPLACGGLSVIWTLGLFFETGRRINLVSSVLALVVVVISMTNSIHLINYFLHRFKRSGDKRDSIKDALDHALLPCLIATLTTVLGFITLATSRIPAVTDFILFASLGVVISFLLTGTLVPILLYRWVDFDSARRTPFERGLVAWILQKILWLMENHRLRLVLLSAGIFCVLGYGATRIHTTMNVMDSFPQDSPVTEATLYLQENFIGAHSLEVLIVADQGDLLTVDNLKKVEALDRFINRQPEVKSTLSALLFALPYLETYLGAPEELKKIMPMNQSFRSTLAMLHPSQRELLRVFMDRDYRSLRISVFLKTADSQMVSRFANRIEEEGRRVLGPDMRTELTGELLLLSRISTDLVQRLLVSLLQAFGIILLVIGILFRSVKAVLVSFLSNLFPLTSLFGIMGWLGIPLSVPTSIIACITLGLAVDDTSHFLHSYNSRRNKGDAPPDAVRKALSTVGRAMIFTSMILVVGFFLGLLSPFDIIVQFGFLAGTTMILALWCDLTLTPVCVLVWEKMSERRKTPVTKGPLTALLCASLMMAPGVNAEADSGYPQAKKTLRMATLAPEGSPWAQLAHEASRMVQEKTQGSVSLKWFLGGIMGDEQIMLERMRAGKLDGAVFSMAGLSRISPSTSLLGLPFLFRDTGEAREITRVLTPRIQERFLEQGVVLTGLFSLGFGRIFTVKPVETLEELTGLRTWTWKGEPLSEKVLSELGFHRLVPLQMTDVLPALQYDMLDAFSGTYVSITVFQWFIHARHVVPLNWTYAMGGIVFGRNGFFEIAAQDQEVLRDVMEDFAAKLTEDALRTEQDAENSLTRKEGLRKVFLPRNDRDVLETRARKFYDALAAQIHEEQMLQEILATLSGIRAGPVKKIE